MEDKYWKQFTETGKITDYLYYRGMQICSRVISSYEGEKVHEPDYSNRYDTCGDTGRRI